jgi:hypothetical protein
VIRKITSAEIMDGSLPCRGRSLQGEVRANNLTIHPQHYIFIANKTMHHFMLTWLLIFDRVSAYLILPPKLNDIARQFRMKPMLIGMATPIALDVVAIVMALHGMAGGAYMSEGFIGILFKLANWPSISFKIPPFDYSDYKLFDCLYPKILVVNIVAWGILGIPGNFIVNKKQEAQ